MMAAEPGRFASTPGPSERHLTPDPSPQSGEGRTATTSYPPGPPPSEGGGRTTTSPPVASPLRRDEGIAPREGRGGDRRATRLGQRIAALPELERTVLGLWFQEELSLDEIAEVLEMGLAEVKAAFARGGLALRNGKEGV